MSLPTVHTVEGNVDMKIQRNKDGSFSLTGCPMKMALISDALMSAYNRRRYDGGICKHELEAYEDMFVSINRALHASDWWYTSNCDHCKILTGSVDQECCPYKSGGKDDPKT